MRTENIGAMLVVAGFSILALIMAPIVARDSTFRTQIVTAAPYILAVGITILGLYSFISVLKRQLSKSQY